jgi:hypothetical protein
MRRSLLRRCASTLSFAGLLWAVPALAQSAEDIKIARQTAVEALSAYNAGDLDRALGLFEQARALYPSGQILRMVGYSQIALEHWAKAIDALEAALRTTVAPLPAEDRKDVEEQMAKAMSHFGKVSVTSRVTEALLSVDGGPAHPLPLDAPLRLSEGLHSLVVTASGHTAATTELNVEGGTAREVDLEPPTAIAATAPRPVARPTSPAARDPWIPHSRTIGFAAMGTGAALGVVALVTGIESAFYRSLANGNIQAYNSGGCSGGWTPYCGLAAQVTNQQIDLADTFQNTAVGFGIAAGAFVLAGGTLVLLVHESDTTRSLPRQGFAPRGIDFSCSPSVGPGFACVGAF